MPYPHFRLMTRFRTGSERCSPYQSRRVQAATSPLAKNSSGMGERVVWSSPPPISFNSERDSSTLWAAASRFERFRFQRLATVRQPLEPRRTRDGCVTSRVTTCFQPDCLSAVCIVSQVLPRASLGCFTACQLHNRALAFVLSITSALLPVPRASAAAS